MSHGSTLGKFAPLQRGHQHFIETALAECDRVTVLVYDCPETTDVPFSLRAVWTRGPGSSRPGTAPPTWGTARR